MKASKTSEKMRADQLLVKLGIAPSRTKAQDLVSEGIVKYKLKNKNDDGLRILTSSSQTFVPEEVLFEVSNSQSLKYVSRGGLKLEAALRDLNVSPGNMICLDVGVSTGGFADVLLQNGAKEVWGFDVGKDQIHPEIKNNPKAKIYEGVHLSEFSQHKELSARSYDLIVIDVSFISLNKALEATLPSLKKEGVLLALIKPQFELGPAALGKGGLIKDTSQVEPVLKSYIEDLKSRGFKSVQTIMSDVKGRDGNQEYFLYGIS